MHGVSAGRRCLVGLLVAVAALLVGAGSAWAHARISPVVVESKQLQLFTLAVPTEKENLTTTKIELTVPQGFGIDSFVPAPGWKRQVQQTGSGEDAVIQKVTWTGGSVPTGEDSLFQFLADPSTSKTYHLHGPPDLLRRLGRRLVGPRELGHALADDRGEELARRRRELDARDRRSDPRRRSRSSSRSSACSRGREAARWHDRPRPGCHDPRRRWRRRSRGRPRRGRTPRSCARCPRRAGS